jgi:DNA-binding LytR/AlgR family response regulator
MSIRCIIIEDEPAAREIIEHYLSQCHDVIRCGVFDDPFKAQAFLDSNSIDLMFLDINLPGMSGLSFLKTLVRPPLVIVTTAYPQYAVEGFDLEVVDYLLKPFSFERFCKSLNKVKDRFKSKEAKLISQKITVRADKRIYQIDLNEILFVEACGDYTSVYCNDKKLTTHETLKNWEEKLSGYLFEKIHRSFLINLQKIDHIEGNMAIIGKHKLIVSEMYRENLIGRLSKKNLSFMD